MLWTPEGGAHADTVRAKYAAFAVVDGEDLCCAGGSCGVGAYTTEELASLPPGAHLGLGTGNPVRAADPRPGEVVLDLGSGAGADILLAARAVGPRGKAIGVDFTPGMIERARENAARAGVTNVDLYVTPIEKLPLPDASVDVVISNCVINLSTDKSAVLRETYRVLRPDGRFVVSDALRFDGNAPDGAPSGGCATGALSPAEWEAALAKAGFRGAHVDVESSGPPIGHGIVRATRPRSTA